MSKLELITLIGGVVIIGLTAFNLVLFLATKNMKEDIIQLQREGSALNRRFLYDVEKNIIKFDGLLKEINNRG